MSDPSIPTFEEFKKNRVPTFDEFKASRQKAADKPSSPTFGQRAMEFGVNATKSLQSAVDVGVGAAKGLGHTALHLGQFARLPIGVSPQQKEFESGLEHRLQPMGTAQKWGFNAEQFAEFFIPTGTGEIKAAASAPRWVKMLVGAGREALDIGMKTYAQTKDPAAAMKAAGVGAALGGAGGLLSRAEVGPIIKTRLSPKEAASVGEVAARGVPVSAADVTGSRVLKTAEQMASYTPGAIGPMAEHAAEKTAKGTAALTDIPRAMPGRMADSVEAGQGVEAGVRGHITDLKKDADAAYDTVREKAAAARREMQVGTTTEKSSVINPTTGKPFETTTPVMQTVEFPTRMEPIRNSLKPYYDELTGRLPQTVRDASPGYAALKALVEGEDVYVDALKVDRDLSVVKGFLRRYGTGLKDKSGRYAAAVVNELEGGITRSIGGESPEALDALRAGRAAVTKYHAADELLSRLLPKNASPSVIYDRLTQSSGRLLPDLQELNRIAPGEVQTVAKTYMQGLVNDMTRNGRLENLKTSVNKLRALQPEVRNILFGARQAERVDNFLQGLSDIGADTNPSGTGKWRMIMGALETAAFAGHSMLMGNLENVGADVGMAAVTMAGARTFAALLTSERGIRLLTQAVRLPESSMGFNKALQALGAMSAEDSTRTGSTSEESTTGTASTPGR